MPDIPIALWIVVIPALIVAIQKYWDLQNQRTIKRLDLENKRDSDAKAAEHAAQMSALQVQLENMRQEQAMRLNEANDDTRIRAELTKHWHDALDLAEAHRVQRDNLQRAYMAIYYECARAIAQDRPPDISDVTPRPAPNLPARPWTPRRQDPPLDPQPRDDDTMGGEDAPPKTLVERVTPAH